MKEPPKIWLPDPGDSTKVTVSKDGVEVDSRALTFTLRPTSEKKTGFEKK